MTTNVDRLCEWFSWIGGNWCENCGGSALSHKGLRWTKPGSKLFDRNDDMFVDWEDYGPERKFNVPLLTHCMGEELYEALHSEKGRK